MNIKNTKTFLKLIFSIVILILTIPITKTESYGANDFGECKRYGYDINQCITSGAIIMSPNSRNGAKEYEYTGRDIKPHFSLKTYKGTPLVEGRDYTVTYAQNVKVGNSASAFITGKNIFCGMERYAFKIVKGKISNANISLSATAYTYDGAEKKPSVTVKHREKTLKLNTDYTVTYKNNKNAGKATVVVTGKGNYSGKQEKNFTINKRSIAGGSITLHRNSNTGYTYTGGAIKPGIDAVFLKNGKTKVYDYKVEYKNNVKAGTGTVVVTGTNNNTGSISKTFKINKRNITGGSITLHRDPNTGYTYTGGAIKPGIDAVFMKNGKTKVNDYSVSYKNNVKVGTATITVTGTNNNTGSISRTFKINKRNISNAKINLESSAYTYTGKEIKPKIKSITLNGSSIKDDYNVSYTNNVKIGTATVTITGYNNNTGTAKTTFKIEEKPKYAVVSRTGRSDYPNIVKVGNKQYKIFNQGEYGQAIAEGGCSITSESIVLSGYGINKTPTETSARRGVTLFIDQIAQNLNDEEISAKSVVCKANVVASTTVKNQAIKNITNNLNSGKPVIILVRTADSGSADHRYKYTRAAHYMALVGYSKNGNPLIADPNGGKTWDDDSIETLVNEYIYDYDSADLEQGDVLITE